MSHVEGRRFELSVGGHLVDIIEIMAEVDGEEKYRIDYVFKNIDNPQQMVLSEWPDKDSMRSTFQFYKDHILFFFFETSEKEGCVLRFNWKQVFENMMHPTLWDVISSLYNFKNLIR